MSNGNGHDDGAGNQPRILPKKTIDFLRTKPRKPNSLRGARRDWSVIPGVGYRMDVPDIQFTFDVRHVRMKFDEVWGLLTVRTQLSGANVVADNIMSSADFSFSSARARVERSKLLSDKSGAPEIDFPNLIEELCLKLLAHEERGEPELFIEDVASATLDHNPDIIAAGMPLLRQHPVIWFGDGGAAKSLLALYAAIDLAENDYRVLYCDWELTAEEHAKRTRQLLLGDIKRLNKRLVYRRCTRPLVDDILPIREIIAKHHIQFLICDSLSFGAKPPIESSESALAYQQALRACGDIGSLHIAHTNRSDHADERPFGSVYWHNMARSTWFLKRSKDQPYPNEITVGCYNRKANLTALRQPFAQRIIFERGTIAIGPGDLESDETLVKPLNLPQKILLALQRGPMSREALIAETLGDEKPETFARKLRALIGGQKVSKVLGSDGTERLQLCV